MLGVLFNLQTKTEGGAKLGSRGGGRFGSEKPGIRRKRAFVGLDGRNCGQMALSKVKREKKPKETKYTDEPKVVIRGAPLKKKTPRGKGRERKKKKKKGPKVRPNRG